MPIHWSVDGPIATITIEGSNRMNPFTYEMYADLGRRLFHDLDNDPAIKVAILTGHGESAFSVGHDLKHADEIQKSGEDQDVYGVAPIFYNPWPPVMTQKTRTPVIGAAKGWCLGAGCIIFALNCSLRIAGESARFGYTEIKRAMAGGSAMARSHLQIPYAAHMWMSALGEPLDAAMALRAGFVNEVLPDAEVMARAREIAEQVAEAPCGTFRAPLWRAHGAGSRRHCSRCLRGVHQP
jgi:enoyl-CoA hydratase/carnithine racemase